jgi:hypothetical protein
MISKANVGSETDFVFPPLGREIKALLVWPPIPNSFWTFSGMVKLLPEKAVMPPLGLITVAALCPSHWKIRLVDQAVEDLTDEDILGADLVMVGAMTVQEAGLREVLSRARRLGRRTMVGGPYASGEPERMLAIADHVVVGEPDEVFPQIARDLEEGTARRLYEITDKPDVTKTPMPRFDLLKLDSYASMSVQFSRGCPFQCEFCDIIILYGRKPRTKLPQQMMAELDELLSLGWKKQVFIVDDNFIGNHARALELCLELEPWQLARGFPVMFYTEASMDLARKPALVEAMVKANFFYVFLGIESPSKESLKEVRKLQNLAMDPVTCVDFLNKKGLWVTGGFIVGFDSIYRAHGDPLGFIEFSPRAAPHRPLRPHAERGPIAGVARQQQRRHSPEFSNEDGSRHAAAWFCENGRFGLRAVEVLSTGVALPAELGDASRPPRCPAADHCRYCQNFSAVRLAPGNPVVLPEGLLGLLCKDVRSVRLESSENLARVYHPDLGPSLYSLRRGSGAED